MFAWKILALCPSGPKSGIDTISSEKLWVPQEPVQRIAILIAGTLRRFNSNADVHLVAPLARANWTVDVFLSLFDGPSKGWRKISNAFQKDPVFKGLNRSDVKRILEWRFSLLGSRLVVNKIFDEYYEASEDIAFVNRNRFWRNKHGAGDGETARLNFIMLLKELEGLWYRALLEEIRYGPYSYVMILRDDAYWFQDFNMSRLLDLRGTEKTEAGPTNKGHVYSQMCETLEVPDPLGLTDHVFLLDRPAAEIFGKAYSRLAHPAHFGREWFSKYERDEAGDMSEHFYLILAEFTQTQVIEVPAVLMPMQRVARFHGAMCLHKYCDSHLPNQSIPWLNPDMPLCKSAQKKYILLITICIYIYI
eukprot:Skav202003  [mRNA]  locus=scaffold269:579329:580414:+ [translate_table: standard]